MIRFILILIAVICYLVAISTALAYLPFASVPEWFKLIFGKNLAATLFWLKIRHTFVVLIIGIIVAFVLTKYDRKRATVDAWIIGVSSATFAVIQVIRIRYGFYEGLGKPVDWSVFLTWAEITDHLLILIAIPLLVLIIDQVNKEPSNTPLHPMNG